MSQNQSNNRPDNWSLADQGFTKVQKTDYFGNPHTAWVRNEKPDLGQLWSKFRDRMNQEDQEQRRAYSIIQADTDLYDESQQLDADTFKDKIELHETLKLIEND